MPENLYDVLAARELIAQRTHEDLRERLAEPRTGYIGFDPTADSLHIGNLVPIMALAWLQRCGHKPLALVGGATGLIGDPSGKTESRRLLDAGTVSANARAIGRQIGRVVGFDGSPTGAELVDNLEWFGDKEWIELLREVGPHFSVNRMLSMDSVKGRLSAGGISFLEFTYMVMQAYDFLHLHRSRGCSLQVGGQDQWGNIVMGVELGRRVEGAEFVGLTLPLVTRADGGKFGKTERGTVWLDAARTPVFDFYQFWRNVADADVGRYLRYFTFLEIDEIRRLEAGTGRELNPAKEVLAREVTALIHGADAADRAETDARRAFGAADVTGTSLPHGSLDAGELEAGLGLLVALVRAGLASSNSEARRLVAGGGVRVHDTTEGDPTRVLTTADLRDGHLLLRAGKKRLFRFDVG